MAPQIRARWRVGRRDSKRISARRGDSVDGSNLGLREVVGLCHVAVIPRGNGLLTLRRSSVRRYGDRRQAPRAPFLQWLRVAIGYCMDYAANRVDARFNAYIDSRV